MKHLILGTCVVLSAGLLRADEVLRNILWSELPAAGGPLAAEVVSVESHGAGGPIRALDVGSEHALHAALDTATGARREQHDDEYDARHG